jgi:hypothetical protein
MTDRTDIERVYLIFKTHLDLGFTDFAEAVANEYFSVFIPRAIALARELRESNSPDRFVWTTGSWLVYEYLERAEAPARRDAERAILAGDLAWHAIPFTFHTEMASAETFRYGLRLSQRLDERFGRHTIAAKMTDVPGHTRAIVPILAEAGVRFLHLGRNRASAPPAVPQDFVWRHDDGSEIVVTYHHDYGYSSSPVGMTSAIAFAHGRDNHPPQNALAVSKAFRKLRNKYPNASVRAATLDDYGREVWSNRSHLPVITGELGDTWIHGIASHPERLASYRALARLRRQWIEDGRFDDDQNRDQDRFSRLIMCVPEHTWGIMVDQLDDPFVNSFEDRVATHKMHFEVKPGMLTGYDRQSFEQLRKTDRWRRVEASWSEQLNYTRQAVDCLQGELHSEAVAALSELEARNPDLTGWARVQPGERIEGARFAARVDGSTGGLNDLFDKSTGRRWADPSHQIGHFMFENFDRADFDRFARQYLRNKKRTVWWNLIAFTKLGMDPDRCIRHRAWQNQVDAVWSREREDWTDVLVSLRLPAEATSEFGAPGRVQVQTSLSSRQPLIRVELRWFDKRARRLPAACWIGINPLVENPRKWMLRKMDSWISPFEVVRNGNRRLHAIEEAVCEGPHDHRVSVVPLDSSLCAPGRPSLTDFHQRQPAMSGGLWFNLWNNVWNTNFPYWHEGDCRFRFEIDLDADSGP